MVVLRPSPELVQSPSQVPVAQTVEVVGAQHQVHDQGLVGLPALRLVFRAERSRSSNCYYTRDVTRGAQRHLPLAEVPFRTESPPMTSNTNSPELTAQGGSWRIAPSIPVAAAVFVAYAAVFTAISSTSGIPYADWFANGENALRTAVFPLIGGSLVLIAFLLWARWDFVFKDPERLPMYGVLWVPVSIFAVGIVVHFAIADWSSATSGLLLAILAAGVMVGFAEETLFRGIILRSLRTNLRPEAWVMLILSLWFGFFHLTNLFNGSPIGAVLFQCVQASAAGVVLYAFRRVRGLLVAGMIAHGLSDMSLFVPGASWSLSAINLPIQMLVFVTAIIAAFVILRRDRKITVAPEGVQSL